MKHLSGLLNKLTAVAAVAVALTSCNRAEYAMLPKTSSAYHGTQRSTIVKPAPAVAHVAEEAVTPASEAVAPVVAAQPVAPAVAEKPAVAVAFTKVASVKKEATRAETKTAGKGVKLNAAQKVMLAKLDKKADKLAAKLTKSDTASANAISSNLKLGLILVLVGALITILPGGIFNLLGSIVAIIGIVFIILALLDMA